MQENREQQDTGTETFQPDSKAQNKVDADSSRETATAAGMPAETMPGMAEMLREAERKAQEHYDAWMYAKAEGENIRRRAAEDISKAQKFAVERFSGHRPCDRAV